MNSIIYESHIEERQIFELKLILVAFQVATSILDISNSKKTITLNNLNVKLLKLLIIYDKNHIVSIKQYPMFDTESYKYNFLVPFRLTYL